MLANPEAADRRSTSPRQQIKGLGDLQGNLISTPLEQAITTPCYLGHQGIALAHRLLL
jgi:hypothetical protein